MHAQVLPFCVALTFFVIVVFIIQTGNKNKTWSPALGEGTLLWVSAVVGVGMGLLCLFFLMPFLRKRVIAWEAEQNRSACPLFPLPPLHIFPAPWVHRSFCLQSYLAASMCAWTSARGLSNPHRHLSPSPLAASASGRAIQRLA